MPVARSAKRRLAPTAKVFAPRLYWRRKYDILQPSANPARTCNWYPNSVAAITELLTGLGYEGYFDVGDGRRPVEEFDAARHQDLSNIGGREDGWAARGVYVNNFVFVPKGA
jgi:hypothetical protein